MWVVYHQETHKIVGLTANTDIDMDRQTALTGIVDGLVDRHDVSEYDAIQVTDRDKAALYMDHYPKKLALVEGAEGLKLTIREPERFALYLTCDAPDQHPVDGIPEIAADGKSYTTITIQKIDERHKLQRGSAHNDRLYLRTNHGVLRDAKGTEDISFVELKEGKASVRLVSERLKRVATVQVMSADQKLADAFINIEFI